MHNSEVAGVSMATDRCRDFRWWHRIVDKRGATFIHWRCSQGMNVAPAVKRYDQKLMVGLLTAMCRAPLEVKTLTTVLAEL